MYTGVRLVPVVVSRAQNKTSGSKGTTRSGTKLPVNFLNQYNSCNMNNKLSIACLILITPFFFGCGGPAKGENKTSASVSSLSLHTGDEKYAVVDTKESIVTWKGSMVIGSDGHNGYIYISKGELMIEDGQLVGGTVEVDMNTIEDEGHGRDNNLVNHLKDPDFFDAKKFPYSAISITGVTSISAEEKEITGNLTIKGITHPVSFPAKIEVNDKTVRASGRLVIDRTQWDVRYRSGKFFNNLADKAIADSIEFNVAIVAKR